MKPVKIASFVLVVIFGLLWSVFTFWHWKLGLIRYFDVDEYAHLHYASQMLIGHRPYVDFLSFFPPGFAWFLTPALIFGWGTIQPFLTARIMMFLVFVASCVVSGLIFWHVRKSLWGAIAAMMFLAFLPMPFDKYLEIRPDNLAALCILIAVYFQIKWMDNEPHKALSKHKIDIAPVLSGSLYALSYIVLPKMLPNIAVGMGVAALYILHIQPLYAFRDMKHALMHAKPFLVGFGVPLFLFALWLITLGDLSRVLYSHIALPFESNRISKYFIMVPFLFFYPNATFYGQDGWSRGLVVNHVLWEAALLFSVYRLVTPYLAPGGVKRVFAEILLAATTLVQVLFYVEIVPLKHTQYLIPIGIFVAWYTADILLALYGKIVRWKFGVAGFVGIAVLFAPILYQVFFEVNSVKQFWTNSKPFAEIAAMYGRIPKNEPVLDLDGRMLYNPDPYYACCIPFGQFAEFLSKPLPDLPTVLKQKNVKYINQGELQRVNTLPWEWQQYIYANYHADGDDTGFLIRNDVKLGR